MKSELELFHVPDTQSSIGNSNYIRYFPLTSLERGGPVEFVIHGNADNYFDLSETLLYAEFTIVYSDGNNISKIAGSTTTGYSKQLVAPVNSFQSSFFRSCEVHLNSQLVSQSDNLYPYKAYIQNLLSYDENAKKTFLSRYPYYEDTGDDLDSFPDNSIVEEESEVLDADNQGLAKRFLLSRNSKTF